ncbi:hypothetical protein F511_19874 [Dorcoceras hygrometricum]|uniref:Uncharacterized protein n=1 Tax=Dorcoceras hygrometricum TaxID=472368 RepID=A0A2Z7A7M4_9LAMI|nr:hypothetical protein F511_19874 [Dorcoceras hygrometricum]
MRQHKVEWTRPCSSKLFERDDVQSEGIHPRFYPSIKSTSWVRSLILIDESWTIAEGIDPWWRCGCRSAVPISRKKKLLPHRPFVDAFAPICIFIDPVQDLDCRNLTPIFIDELKAALSGKITNLEIAFAQTNTRQNLIFRIEMHALRQEIEIQKAALTRYLNDFRKETHMGIDTLSAQLSEIIAYINRGRDDKKGEEGSRCPPPDDRSRPGGGSSRPGEGGSRSESPKIGGSNRGGGSNRSRGVHLERDSSDRMFTEAVFIKSSSGTFLKRKKERRRI